MARSIEWRPRARASRVRVAHRSSESGSMMNTIGRSLRMALVPLALAALAACASPFRADVSRFQPQLPPPAGQPFPVVAEDPELQRGIELRHYDRKSTRLNSSH